MFEEMFSLPMDESVNNVEGTEENPIEIPDVVELEFDLFVSQAYGR